MKRRIKSYIPVKIPNPEDQLRMWFHVSILCLSCLSLATQSHGEDQASLHHSNDQNGRCQYTFTVASPKETTCPGSSGKPEMEGVLSRLTLLEALVSRLIAEKEGDGRPGAEADGEGDLRDAYSQVTGERNQLQQEKERLSRQIQELQRNVAELSLEAENLRQKPCQQTPTSEGPQNDNSKRPASGMYIST